MTHEYDYITSFSVRTLLVNSNVVNVITGGDYSHSYLFFILRLWEEAMYTWVVGGR